LILAIDRLGIQKHDHQAKRGGKNRLVVAA
jgi:hypothetical protein